MNLRLAASFMKQHNFSVEWMKILMNASFCSWISISCLRIIFRIELGIGV